jgi:hypothetical protein
MAIDTSGKWYRGESFADLAGYIRLLTEDSYPADPILQAICVCGNTTFRLFADPAEGCAQRECTRCRQRTFICDSADYWDEAGPRQMRCPVGHRIFELGVGFSLRRNAEVRWITIGQRCVKCGALVSRVDWEVNYGPSRHLLTQV